MSRKSKILDARKVNPRTRKAEFDPYSNPEFEEDIAALLSEDYEGAAYREKASEQESGEKADYAQFERLKAKQELGTELTPDEQAFLKTYDKGEKPMFEESPLDVEDENTPTNKKEYKPEPGLPQPTTEEDIKVAPEFDDGRRYTPQDTNAPIVPTGWLMDNMASLAQEAAQLKEYGMTYDPTSPTSMQIKGVPQYNLIPPGGWTTPKAGLTEQDIVNRDREVRSKLKRAGLGAPEIETLSNKITQALKDGATREGIEPVLNNVVQALEAAGLSPTDARLYKSDISPLLYGTQAEHENIGVQIDQIGELLQHLREEAEITGKVVVPKDITNTVQRAQRLWDTLGKPNDLRWASQTLDKTLRMLYQPSYPARFKTIPGFEGKQKIESPQLVTAAWELITKAPDSIIPPHTKDVIDSIYRQKESDFINMQQGKPQFESKFTQMLKYLNNAQLSQYGLRVKNNSRPENITQDVQSREARVLSRAQDDIVNEVMEGRGSYGGGVRHSKDWALNWLRNTQEGLTAFLERVNQVDSEFKEAEEKKGLKQDTDPHGRKYWVSQYKLNPSQRKFVEQFQYGVPEMFAILRGDIPLKPGEEDVVKDIRKMLNHTKGNYIQLFPYKLPIGHKADVDEETGASSVIPVDHPLYEDLPWDQRQKLVRELVKLRGTEKEKGKRYIPVGSRWAGLNLKRIKLSLKKEAEGAEDFFNFLADATEVAGAPGDTLGKMRGVFDKSVENKKKDRDIQPAATYLYQSIISGIDSEYIIPRAALNEAEQIYKSPDMTWIQKYDALDDLKRNRLRMPNSAEVREAMQTGKNPTMTYVPTPYRPSSSQVTQEDKVMDSARTTERAPVSKKAPKEETPLAYEGPPNRNITRSPSMDDSTPKQGIPIEPRLYPKKEEGGASPFADMMAFFNAPDEEEQLPPSEGGLSLRRKANRRRDLNLRRKRADIYNDMITVSDEGRRFLADIDAQGGAETPELFQMGLVLKGIDTSTTPFTYATLKQQYDSQFGRPIVDEMMSSGYLSTNPMPTDTQQPQETPVQEESPVETPVEEVQQGKEERPPMHIALTNAGRRKLDDMVKSESAGMNLNSSLLVLLQLVKDIEDSGYPVRDLNDLDKYLGMTEQSPGTDIINFAIGQNPEGVRYLELFEDDPGQFEPEAGRENLVGGENQHLLNTTWHPEKLSEEEKAFITRLHGNNPLTNILAKDLWEMAYPQEEELWESHTSQMARGIVEKGVVPNPDIPGGKEWQHDFRKMPSTLEGPTQGKPWESYRHFRRRSNSLRLDKSADTYGPGGPDWSYEFTSGPSPTADSPAKRKKRFPFHNKPSEDLALNGGDQGNIINSKPGVNNMDSLEAFKNGMTKTADNELFDVYSHEFQDGPWLSCTVFKNTYGKFKQGDIVIQFGSTSSDIRTFRRRFGTTSNAYKNLPDVTKTVLAILLPGAPTADETLSDVQTGKAIMAPYKKRTDWDAPEGVNRDGFNRPSPRRKEDTERNVFPYEDQEVSNQTQIFTAADKEKDIEKHAEMGNYSAPVLETPEDRSWQDQDVPNVLNLDPKRPFPAKRKRPTEKNETGITVEYSTQPKVEYI